MVVVGGGAAGLMAALELPKALKVLLLCRDGEPRSASRWAQGGLAAAVRSDDSPSLHRADTLRAGAGLGEPAAVDLLVKEAPGCVERLLQFGLQLDRDGSELSTTLEAAHSRRRVLHAQDQTGLALVELLEQRLKAQANVCCLQGGLATQLWLKAGKCCGLQLIYGGQLGWLQAGAVVLATGGGGHLFANTTNPASARGDGVAMAWEAGAVLRDLEFVQFHPTALMHPGAPHFLLSEALRGEGAQLLKSDGKPLGASEMLPRDQLSRAMVREMQRSAEQRLWLDLKPVGETKLQQQFPMILKRCIELGLAPLQQPLPVAPAAHYWMGGVATNLAAACSITGLYAVGEVASSGIHGANRLASNSLSECLVMAHQLRMLNPLSNPVGPSFNKKVSSLNWNCEQTLMLKAQQASEKLRRLCWQVAGVERWGSSLEEAIKIATTIQQELNLSTVLKPILEQPQGELHNVNEAQLTQFEVLWDQRQRNLVSLLLLKAAAFREESRGGHFRRDAPAALPYWCRHSLQRIGEKLSTAAVGEAIN